MLLSLSPLPLSSLTSFDICFCCCCYCCQNLTCILLSLLRRLREVQLTRWIWIAMKRKRQVRVSQVNHRCLGYAGVLGMLVSWVCWCLGYAGVLGMLVSWVCLYLLCDTTYNF